jgi:hypothetical protein
MVGEHNLPSAIGLRVYQLTVAPRGAPEPIDLRSAELRVLVPDFLTRFVGAHTTVRRNDDAERSWYFEEAEDNGPGLSKGYLHYGTFGFESRFVDTNTQATSYNRQVSDIEEVPLFYEVWTPSRGRSAFIAFQTFRGRSCANLVLSAMRNEFEGANPNFLLRYTNLMPSDFRGSLYHNNQVKRVRLIKRNSSRELANRLLQEPNPVDMEIILSARRKGFFGRLGDVAEQLRENAEGVVAYDGIEFDEARADVQVGNKLRPVGVFGGNRSVGLIDLTNDIDEWEGGHPKFESIAKESSDILEHFYSIVSGSPA